MTTPSRPIGPQRFGLTLTTLGLALPALFSGASARAQGYTVPSYVFSSVAMDYPAAAPNSTAYSLQATAGQTFATIDQPTNTGQTLAALGFFETGVKYLYTGHVALENFTGNVSTVPLDLRFWNNIDNSLSDEVQGFALSNGNFTVATWANPTFNAGLSLKGDRWLRQRVAPTPPVNPATDYPFASFNLLGGDANNDNAIDNLDLGLLASAYASSVGDPNFDVRADFNGDGSVDNLDLGILANNYTLNGDE